MIKEIIIKIRIYDKKDYIMIYKKNYLQFYFNQFLRHIHI